MTNHNPINSVLSNALHTNLISAAADTLIRKVEVQAAWVEPADPITYGPAEATAWATVAVGGAVDHIHVPLILVPGCKFSTGRQWVPVLSESPYRLAGEGVMEWALRALVVESLRSTLATQDLPRLGFRPAWAHLLNVDGEDLRAGVTRALHHHIRCAVADAANLNLSTITSTPGSLAGSLEAALSAVMRERMPTITIEEAEWEARVEFLAEEGAHRPHRRPHHRPHPSAAPATSTEEALTSTETGAEAPAPTEAPEEDGAREEDVDAPLEGALLDNPLSHPFRPNHEAPGDTTEGATNGTWTVGQGVRWSGHSDLYAGTVVGVTKTSVSVQEDRGKVLNGANSGEPDALVFHSGGFVAHCEGEPRYRYTQDLTARVRVFTRRKNGEWVQKGEPMRNGYRLKAGRIKRHDFNY